MDDQEFEKASKILNLAFCKLLQYCDTNEATMATLAADLLLKFAECLIEMVSCFFSDKDRASPQKAGIKLLHNTDFCLCRVALVYVKKNFDFLLHQLLQPC